MSTLRHLEMEILKLVEQYYSDSDNLEARDESDESIDHKIIEIQKTIDITREIYKIKYLRIKEEKRLQQL